MVNDQHSLALFQGRHALRDLHRHREINRSLVSANLVRLNELCPNNLLGVSLAPTVNGGTICA